MHHGRTYGPRDSDLQKLLECEAEEANDASGSVKTRSHGAEDQFPAVTSLTHHNMDETLQSVVPNCAPITPRSAVLRPLGVGENLESAFAVCELSFGNPCAPTHLMSMPSKPPANVSSGSLPVHVISDQRAPAEPPTPLTEKVPAPTRSPYFGEISEVGSPAPGLPAAPIVGVGSLSFSPNVGSPDIDESLLDSFAQISTTYASWLSNASPPVQEATSWQLQTAHGSFLGSNKATSANAQDNHITLKPSVEQTRAPAENSRPCNPLFSWDIDDLVFSSFSPTVNASTSYTPSSSQTNSDSRDMAADREAELREANFYICKLQALVKESQMRVLLSAGKEVQKQQQLEQTLQELARA